MAAKRAAARTAQPTRAGPGAPKARPKREAPGGTSAWEWAAASVGAVILTAIVGFLIYEGVSRPPEARPLILVTSDPVVALTEGVYLVPIHVENRGHVTGAGVAVSGVLMGPDGGVVEESAVTFDFVAQHSSVAGGLYFTTDPRENRVVLRVEGYTDP